MPTLPRSSAGGGGCAAGGRLRREAPFGRRGERRFISAANAQANLNTTNIGLVKALTRLSCAYRPTLPRLTLLRRT